jgi:hypothetical protein
MMGAATELGLQMQAQLSMMEEAITPPRTAY